MKKRVQTSLLCAVLLAAQMLPSCGQGEVETMPETAADTTETESVGTDTTSDALAKVEENYDWRAGIAQKDYDGYAYTILNGCTAEWYSYTLIAPEDTTGEPVKDAFVERNNRVGEYLNVKIVENNVKDSAAMLKKEVQAGTGDFDIALVTLENAFTIAMEGSLIDLNTLSSVDFTQSWWDQNAISDLTVNGKMYFTTGDFDTTRFDGIRSLFFNKALIEQNHLDDPYALVDSGKWTMDKFTEMCLAVISDLDGDGEMTDADRYGYVAYGELIADILLYGMNERYIGKETDKIPEGAGRPGAGADVHGKQGVVLFGVHGVVACAAGNGGGFRCGAAAEVRRSAGTPLLHHRQSVYADDSGHVAGSGADDPHHGRPERRFARHGRSGIRECDADRQGGARHRHDPDAPPRVR